MPEGDGALLEAELAVLLLLRLILAQRRREPNANASLHVQQQTHDQHLQEPGR